jgi:hypothetical protein
MQRIINYAWKKDFQVILESLIRNGMVGPNETELTHCTIWHCFPFMLLRAQESIPLGNMNEPPARIKMSETYWPYVGMPVISTVT